MDKYISFQDFAKKAENGLIKVEGLKKDSREAFFYLKDGTVVKMYHWQDCCEYVVIEDIDNEADIYTDTNFCEIEEVSNTDWVDECERCTWTFYKIRTNKGYATIRWYGTSNGYYSERVDFALVNKKNQGVN